jgi:hypothetical protein
MSKHSKKAAEWSEGANVTYPTGKAPKAPEKASTGQEERPWTRFYYTPQEFLDIVTDVMGELDEYRDQKADVYHPTDVGLELEQVLQVVRCTLTVLHNNEWKKSRR